MRAWVRTKGALGLRRVWALRMAEWVVSRCLYSSFRFQHTLGVGVGVGVGLGVDEGRGVGVGVGVGRLVLVG
jgi:hypothetical protein